MPLFKMQLACLCVLLYVGFYYFKIKRLDISSAYIFKAMLFFGSTNLIFDAITVYTVNNIATVSPLINRMCHQFFIGSLDIFIFLICCYILSIVEGEQTQTVVSRLLLFAPLLVSMVMVIFAPLYYNTDTSIGYSYGPMAITCYSSVGLYLILALKFIMQYWRKIDRKKREAILPVLLLMIFISLFQLFVPTALISGIGVTLVLLGIFMAMENPAEYLTNTFELFNNRAFSIVASDRVHRKKSFVVLSVAYRGESLLAERYEKLILQLNQFVTEKLSLSLYIPLDGYLTIVVDDEKKVPSVIKALEERFRESWEIEHTHIKTEADFNSFSYPAQFSTVQEFLDMLKAQVENARWNIAFMDRSLGIKNRNGFEHTFDIINKNRHEFSSIWYLMADVNNLKDVNDTMGHLAGDKLLQDCADVLTAAVGAETDVARIGGDEFAIILVSKTAEQIGELLKNIEICRQRCNESRTPPLSFAIGYSEFDKKHDRDLTAMIERADREMYENKLIMKRAMGETVR